MFTLKVKRDMRALWDKADRCFGSAGIILRARKSMWSAGFPAHVS